MTLAEPLAGSNIISSDIPLGTSFEQLLAIEPAQAGVFAIRGLVRFSCSVVGNCIDLRFEVAPDATTLEIHGRHETGHNLDRDIWYHDDGSITGYQPSGVEEANRVYILDFTGVLNSEDLTPEIRVNARGLTGFGTVTALPGSFIEATLIT